MSAATAATHDSPPTCCRVIGVNDDDRLSRLQDIECGREAVATVGGGMRCEWSACAEHADEAEGIGADVKGGWQDEGVVYNDECRVYLVFLGSLTKGGDVATAVAFAKSHYAQLAIAIRYLGLAEIL